jgi:hypothetical protein
VEEAEAHTAPAQQPLVLVVQVVVVMAQTMTPLELTEQPIEVAAAAVVGIILLALTAALAALVSS